MDLDHLMRLPPYEKKEPEKNSILFPALVELTDLHLGACESYRKGVELMFPKHRDAKQMLDLPYLPVSLFKQFQLRSVPEKDVFKVLKSSGTMGEPSQIYLDTLTAKRQTQALSQIMQSFIGKQRLPMLIVDSPSVIKDRRSFSARGAGILGMMNFGRRHFYALHDDMSLNVEGVAEWLAEHRDKPILVFGFTFMIWQYLFKALDEDASKSIDLSNAVIIHSGGWKKLIEESVSNEEYKRRLKIATGVERVHNFYGMVEQVGSVFVECEEGCFHAPLTGDVLVRQHENLEPSGQGEKGIVQVISLLPQSYPGHSLLTEDEGTILGVDDCPCGRSGTRFLIHGRLAQAELRGCSDTHAAELQGLAK